MRPDPNRKKTIAGTFFIICADQLTKLIVRVHYADGGSQVIIPDFFSLVYLKNTGAAWGIFSKQTSWLVLFSLIVLLLLYVNFSKLTDNLPLRVFALTLISGGICGNLIDRIFHGGVIDFLLFYYKNLQWPVFNLADSAITVGVFSYILSIFISDTQRRNKAPASALADVQQR